MTAPDEDAELERLARVDEIVTAAVARSREGVPIDVEEIVAAHPGLAHELRAALGGVAKLERVAQDATPTDEANPGRLGPYRVVRLIGRGGMGLVYEAHDETLDRRVALKMLPTSADRAYVDRFKREAHAAARLEHPHVVPIYGVDELDGRPYLVMKYVDGLVLDHPNVKPMLARSAVTRGSPSGDSSDVGIDGPIQVNVARLGLGCAEALAFAHERGVLHRDIKPGNILVDRRGRPWITDFGLAKLDEVDDDLTREGDFVGTLRYTAPEQFQGAAEPRSDVYALGLVLYELMTGQPAQEARTRSELIHELLYVMPRSPERVRPDVPPDLARITMKALAKLPDERYASADDLAHDLRAFLAGRPIAARVPSAMYLARLAVNRNRPLFAAIGALVAIVLVGAVLYGMQLQRSAHAEEALAYRANLAAAAALMSNGDTKTARRRLDDCPEALRGWEWRHLSAGVDQSHRTVARLEAPIRTLEVHGDALHILTRMGLEVHRGDEVQRIAPPSPADRRHGLVAAARTDFGWVTYHTRSGLWHLPPDGVVEPVAGTGASRAYRAPTKRVDAPVQTSIVVMRRGAPRAVLAVRNDQIYVHDVASLREVFRAPHGVGGVAAVACDAPLERLVLAGLDGGVIEWDLLARTSRCVHRAPSALHAVAFRPDLDRLVVAGEDRTVIVLRHSTGETLDQLIGHTECVYSVAVSRDGSMIASAGEDRTIRIWDAVSGELLQALNGHASPVLKLAFSEDGSKLWSGSDGGVVKEWWIGVAGGRTRVRGHIADIAALSFSPDGRQFATGGRDGTVRVHDAASLRLDLLMAEHRSEVWGVAYHAGGRALAAACRNGEVVDWDAITGRQRWRRRYSGVMPAPAVDEVGGRLFVGTHLGDIAALDGETGQVLVEMRGDGPPVESLAFDATRGRLIVGCSDGALLSLDPGTLDEVERQERHGDRIGSIELFADGQSMWTASDDRTIAWSPADRWQRIVRWQVGAEELAWESEALDDIQVSPDGSRAAVVSHNGLVRIVEPRTGELIVDLNAHRSWARRVAFSPDGRTLISTGSRSDVFAWDDRSTRERAATIDARLELETAGRAILYRSVGRELASLTDIDDAFTTLPEADGTESDLARATRAVVHQARAGALERSHEFTLATTWTEERAWYAWTWLQAFERRRALGATQHRLVALVWLVRGDLERAENELHRSRERAGDSVDPDPIILAMEALIADARGVASGAGERARQLASFGGTDADTRAIATAILARIE